MDPLRVLVVTTSWPRDARDPSGHFVRAEVEAMRAGGDDVVLIAPRAGDDGGAFGWPGIAARIAERPTRVLSLGREAVGMRRRAMEAAHARAFDRALLHWGGVTSPIAWDLAREIELVSHGADVRAIVALPPPAREAWVRTLLARTSSWRFVSEALAEDLARSVGPTTRARIHACARVEAPLLGLDAIADSARERGAKIRAEHRDAERVYVSVGRLVTSKRVDRAIAFVAAEGPAARLVVVGDGPERARLVELAATRAVDARFLGTLPRDEALAYIAAADALLHASAAEGLSSVVREAEHFGTRVVRID